MGNQMSPVAFSEFLERERKLMDTTLNKKATEYAPGTDRLGNFNQAGRIANISPASALDGFLLKHYTAYRDMLVQVETDFPFTARPWTQAQIDERFGDIINYFTLQKAIFMVNHCSDAEERTT